MNLEKRALQLAVAIGGLVPVLAGGAGAVAGVAMIPHAAADAALDSHYRYLSGLLLAIGLGFWSAVPGIERHGGRVRLLSALVVTGGLARGFGMLGGTAPGQSMQLALVMELVVTPLICLWQWRLAGQMRPVSSTATGRSAPLPLRAHPGR